MLESSSVQDWTDNLSANEQFLKVNVLDNFKNFILWDEKGGCPGDPILCGCQYVFI